MIPVKRLDKLMTGTKRISKGADLSGPSHIEYQIQIALISEQNPELSFKLNEELIKAKEETADQEYTFG